MNETGVDDWIESASSRLLEQQKEIESLRKELCAAHGNAIECRNERNRLEKLLLEAGLSSYI